MQTEEAAFVFKPFSRKQRMALNWWTQDSPVREADGLIADGSIRSGKTICTSLSFVMWAMESFRGRNFAMCGKTIGAFRRNVLFWLKIMLSGRGYKVEDKRGDNLIIVTANQVTNYFYIFGGTDERSQDLIQGITLAGVFLDEVALMPESFVNQATGRCSVDGSKLWFNCNPEGPSHWFKTEWIDQASDKGLLYLHFTMADNPSLSDRVRARYATMYSGVWYDRFVLGKWTLAEGMIYPMYGDAIKEPPEDERPERFIMSVDYGTQNAFAALIWAKYSEAWYCVREYYYSGRDTGIPKTDEEYATDIDKLTKDLERPGMRLRTIIDPSASSFITLLRRRGKYQVLPADNDVLDGIRETATCLQIGRIKISSQCGNLIQEIQGYVWDDNSGDERPVKENDHACDAMRYFVKTMKLAIKRDQKYNSVFLLGGE